MIKSNQKKFNVLHVIMDAIIIATAYLLAWAIKFKTNLLQENTGHLGIKTYLLGLIILMVGLIILYAICGIYAPRRMHGKWFEVLNVVRADAIGLALFVAGLYIIHQDHFSRMMLLLFFGLDVLFEMMARVFLRTMLRTLRKKGYNQKHILLVGYSRTARGYIDRVLKNPQWGYHIYGILDNTAPAGNAYRGVPILGTLDALRETIVANDFDEVVVALKLADYGCLEEVLAVCEYEGVHTKFAPDYNNTMQSRPYMEDVQGLPLIYVRQNPLSNRWNAFRKRVGDVVLGSLGLLIAAPWMGIFAIIIRMTSPGPVIYKQTRVGYHNKEFVMYKFRTMKYEENNEKRDNKGWTQKGDTRVTTFGRFLRKTSLDELPQFINVLKGEMSLIGPRPERPYYVDIFREQIPRYMLKHQVRPGITGWAQVNGFRGNTSIKKRIAYDLYYIENWSVWFDIKIIFQTIFRGFINKNAY